MGLYWFVSGFMVLISQFHQLVLMREFISNIEILLILAIFLIFIGGLQVLIWRGPMLLNWLKLDRGFDDNRIKTKNITTQQLLRLGCILIGGFTLVDYLVFFLSDLLNWFQFNVTSSSPGMSGLFEEESFSSDALFGVLLGLLLVLGNKWISRKLLPHAAIEKSELEES
jgi:hypothetical protein